MRQGRQPGIYKTWAACEAQVKGFPSAAYKSFTTEDEAKQFIANRVTTSTLTNEMVEQRRTTLARNERLAFVDGSYDDVKQVYGYGVVLLSATTELELYGGSNNAEFVTARNVAGEIAGVQAAITKAVEQQIEKLHIFYDYEGIEKWALGEWRTNQLLTKQYAEFIIAQQKFIKLTFVKVAAHTGIVYNERADALAKLGVANFDIK